MEYTIQMLGSEMVRRLALIILVLLCVGQAGNSFAQSNAGNATGGSGGASTAANQASEIAALQAIQQRAVVFIETTNLSVAASAVITGATRDAGATPQYTKFNTVVSSTQTGTFFLQGSNDNFATVVGIASAVTNANVPAYLSAPVMFRYHRYVFGNGSSTTAATVSANTSYTAN